MLFTNRYILKSVLLFYNQTRLSYPLKLIRYSSSNSLLENPNVQKYLKYIEAEYDEHRNNPKVKINPTVLALLDKRKILQNELKNLLAMSCDNDQDLKKLVLEEKQNYLSDVGLLNSRLVELLTPGVDTERSVILEVSFGVGGSESMLFAKEIYDMYYNYAAYKNWEWSPVDWDESDLGGLRSGSAVVSGKFVYESLVQEAGIHRVQRIPQTDKQGRLHTSTCSVSVLPEPTDAEIVIKEKDIKMTTKQSTGAGGQNVNKRETCVRIVHIPTGIMIEAQSERTQERNKTIAFQKLRRRLYNMQIQEENEKREKALRSQIGLKLRSDKIRTYNYNQNRVTDHRIKETCTNLPSFLLGGKELDYMISQLIVSERKERFLLHVLEKLQSEFYVNLMKAKIS